MIDQKKFRPILNDIAKRSFRDVADDDYVTARLCYINRLYPQYIWHSQQCIEKYLKAILLFHKQSAKKLGHNLQKSHERILNSLSPLGFNLTDDVVNYLKHLDTWGENRYFEKPHFISPNNNIDKLDRAVWEIRRFCRYFDKNFQGYKLELEAIQNATSDKKLPLSVNGKLDKIIKSENHLHHDILTTCNKYFSDFDEDIPTPLHAINPTQTLHAEYFEELNKYIHFPEDVVKAFLEINNETGSE